MNAQVFVVALATGAGVLALWVEVRFPQFAPGRVVGVFLHIVAALACLHVADGLIGAAGDPVLRFVAVFATALPALTYVFLSSIWILRLMRSSLLGSMR